MAEREYTINDREVCDSLCKGLRAQGDILQAAGTSGIPGRGRRTRVLLLTSARTTRIISELSLDRHLNEALMLARSVVERCVNYCYLLYCDQAEYERFWQYFEQKMYRRTSSTVEAAGHTFTVSGTNEIDLDDFPRLKDAVDAFTSRRGREITRWTQKSILGRVDDFCSKGQINAIPFLGCILYIWEDASEALHGTFYGCSFDTGVLPVHVRPEGTLDPEAHLNGNLALLVIFLSELIHAVVEVMHDRCGMGDLFEYSSERNEVIREISRRLVAEKAED